MGALASAAAGQALHVKSGQRGWGSWYIQCSGETFIQDVRNTFRRNCHLVGEERRHRMDTVDQWGWGGSGWDKFPPSWLHASPLHA